MSLIVCIGTWLLIEKTKLGAYLRAATENTVLVQAFGVNVPVLLTLTYGLGVALAAFAGVLAAPIYQVSPLMGSNIIIVVFAVVVVGGMGSIMGAIVTGYMLGVAEGLTKVFYPEASNTLSSSSWRSCCSSGPRASSAGMREMPEVTDTIEIEAEPRVGPHSGERFWRSGLCCWCSPLSSSTRSS